jgi:hypothetical protein
VSHSDLVIRHHRTLDKERASSLKSPSRSVSKPQATIAWMDQITNHAEGDLSNGPESRTRLKNLQSPADIKDDISVQSLPEGTASEIAGEAALKDIDNLLVKRVLQHAVELETQARMLLLHALPKGSPAEVLLRADLVCNVTPFSLMTASLLT